MMIRICSIGFFIAPLLLAAAPALTLADSNTRHVTDSIACGDAILTAQTTYLSTTPDDVDSQVIEQRLFLKNVKTNQEKELKTDGKHIIKKEAGNREVLDAAIELWGCIKSKQEENYFYIVYYCTSGGGKDICKSDKVEFMRFLSEDGIVLFKKPRNWKVGHSEDTLYKSLGLDDNKNVVDMKGLTFYKPSVDTK